MSVKRYFPYLIPETRVVYINLSMIFISKLFQFYRDKQFYWWMKQDLP